LNNIKQEVVKESTCIFNVQCSFTKSCHLW